MNNRYREEEKENNEELQDESNQVKVEVDVENVNEELEKLKDENKRLHDQYLRVLADSENFKKRIEEERIRERKYGCQRIIEKMIPSLDIFDKAINIETDDEKLKNFLIGFEMINNNLKVILEDEGVKKIKALGEKFDPKYHHAVETEWIEGQEEGIITAEMQTGFMYKDRVIRPSLVKVNKKEEKKEKNNKENK